MCIPGDRAGRTNSDFNDLLRAFNDAGVKEGPVCGIIMRLARCREHSEPAFPDRHCWLERSAGTLRSFGPARRETSQASIRSGEQVRGGIPVGSGRCHRERDGCVDLTQVVRAAPCEAVEIDAREKSLFPEVVKGLTEELSDVLVEAEEMAVSGDVDRSELPGPSIDVLKDVMVDGLN